MITNLVGGDWNMTGLCFQILGIASSQLTNSYFSEGLEPPTSICWWHVPTIVSWHIPSVVVSICWWHIPNTITGWWWVEHASIIFPYIGNIWELYHPNWRTHIFQRGWNHQPVFVDDIFPLLLMTYSQCCCVYLLMTYSQYNYWLVVPWTWLDYFSIYWELHHPNWRTHIFRGLGTTNQYLLMTYSQYC